MSTSDATPKVEKGKYLCRCCHAEGEFKSLYASYFRMNGNKLEEFIYSDKLRECFGIELATVNHSQNACGICHTCVVRLRDALDFKLQVLKCEADCTKLICKQEVSTVGIKLEKLDPIDDYGGNIDNGMDEKDFNPITEVKLEEDELSEDTTVIRKKVIGEKRKLLIKKKIISSSVKNAKRKTDETNDTDKDAKAKPFRLLKYIDYERVGDMFRCCRCEKSNKSLDPLREHIKSVHFNIPRYACTELGCKETFLHIGPFTKHKYEIHNIDERHRCNACDRIYTSKIQLSRHKNTFHMMGRLRKCDMCDYECYSAPNLRKHKLSHKTVKDLHCKYCRKGFVRHSNLKLHEKIHTGVKDKVCKECGQAFVQKASLNYHMTKYHPGVPF